MVSDLRIVSFSSESSLDLFQFSQEPDSDLMVEDYSDKSHSDSDLFEFRMNGFRSEDY